MKERRLFEPKIQPKPSYYSEKEFTEQEDLLQDEQQQREEAPLVSHRLQHLQRLYEWIHLPLFERISTGLLEPIDEERRVFEPADQEESDPQIPLPDTPEIDDIIEDWMEDIGEIPDVESNLPSDHVEYDYEQYKLSVQKVIDVYLRQIQFITRTFIQQAQLQLIELEEYSLTDLLSVKYDLHANDLPIDLQHISDYLTKSQVHRRERERFFLRQCRPEKTLKHLKSCHVSLEMTKRYGTIRPDQGSTRASIRQNRLLREMQAEYEVKNRQNIRNLYKYLNSTVILLDENIKALLKELEYKTLLIQKGVWKPKNIQ